MKGIATRVLVAVFVSPFFALVGASAILRFVLAIPRRVGALRVGLARELRCPAGHRLAMASRWSCTSCGATYLGTPVTCGVCGAGADYVVCDCGLAIPLPWEE